MRGDDEQSGHVSEYVRRSDASQPIIRCGRSARSRMTLSSPLATVFARGLEAIANQPRWWRVCVALTSGPVEESVARDTPLNASAP